ncbi:PREDICTED: differentially expressed in FDCP 6 homolog isoform X2 [Cercocebus atys]|uniref:differentially expressed in FDCP 6 homolog isoform X2 n=2 Tax=Cercopithecinae TaxID=9528 RepID=UPI0005F53481|nr:PREDICTED: differentially expressed in FDCP 6 homolog isoform X2 [Cercocebus atys]
MSLLFSSASCLWEPQKAPGLRRLLKGPHMPQEPGGYRTRVRTLRELVPSSHAGSGASEHCQSNRQGSCQHGASRSEQAGGALAPPQPLCGLCSRLHFLKPDLGVRAAPSRAGASAMALRKELLKSIWYAFTALDVEKSGKVSKSQLKVLSHNLYTVLHIPHDPVALEEHFRDDDDGPVSSQGYMPYLNKYILDKVEYLLKKVLSSMSLEVSLGELEELLAQEAQVAQTTGGLSVWQFLELFNSGRCLRGVGRDTLSMAIHEVYQELIQDVLKQGYLWKRGHLRRNWTERWFQLQPSCLCYFGSEECKEKRGIIPLDAHCCVEVLPDRDGKRCMFCVKTATRTYEMSASDTRQRQEWTAAIQMAIRLQAEGKKSLHKDLKQKRREQREQRERRRAAKEEELLRLQQLQEEKERKLQELELLQEAQRQAERLLQEEEERRRSQHRELQQALEGQLREAEQARASMQAEMELKEEEAARQRQRIKELEEMQQRLQEALQLEVKARRDEESVRLAQTRLLEEEEEKLKQLMQLKEEQERYIERAQQEKEELQQEMAQQSRSLQQAQQQLEEVRQNRQRADEDVEAAQRKLRQASTNVKHWNVQMNRLMHPIEPGDKRPVTSSSFTGFQPPLLARRDSSLKRLTRWGSQGNRTPSPNSNEQQKSLNGGDEAPVPASTPQEDKLDPAPEN